MNRDDGRLMHGIYMLKCILMALMQDHSGAKAINHCCMLWATKQAISIKLATTVGQEEKLQKDFVCVQI